MVYTVEISYLRLRMGLQTPTDLPWHCDISTQAGKHRRTLSLAPGDNKTANSWKWLSGVLLLLGYNIYLSACG